MRLPDLRSEAGRVCEVMILPRNRERARAEGESTQALAIERALAARDELIREFRGKVVRLHSDVAAVIQEWCESLRRAQELVRREARPLGVELPS